jgi:hypothetical protein
MWQNTLKKSCWQQQLKGLLVLFGDLCKKECAIVNFLCVFYGAEIYFYWALDNFSN